MSDVELRQLGLQDFLLGLQRLLSLARFRQREFKLVFFQLRLSRGNLRTHFQYRTLLIRQGLVCLGWLLRAVRRSLGLPLRCSLGLRPDITEARAAQARLVAGQCGTSPCSGFGCRFRPHSLISFS